MLFGTSHLVLMILSVLMAAAIGSGFAGRLAALGAVLMSGFALRADPGAGLAWVTLLTGVAVFYTGTGRYSLWKPEDWLIYKKAGEKKPLA
jgi:hypothetical protein